MPPTTKEVTVSNPNFFGEGLLLKIEMPLVEIV